MNTAVRSMRMRAGAAREEAGRRFGPALLRALLWMAMGLALVMVLLIGMKLAQRLHAPVTTLQIEAMPARVEIAALREALEPLTGAHFFDVDLAAARATVSALPWVANARVSRAWPGQLRVQVTEHDPVARLGDGRLLSAAGVVFSVPDTSALEGLPALDVPSADARQAWTAWQALAAGLDGTPLAPEEISRDARGDWRVNTVADIELRLGRGDPLDQLARLRETVQTALAGEFGQVAYVDLRYGNGFAVGWREGASPEGR